MIRDATKSLRPTKLFKLLAMSAALVSSPTATIRPSALTDTIRMSFSVFLSFILVGINSESSRRGWQGWHVDLPTGKWEYSCKYDCGTDVSLKTDELPDNGPVKTV